MERKVSTTRGTKSSVTMRGQFLTFYVGLGTAAATTAATEDAGKQSQGV